jgi:hypothetical protein
VILLKIYKPFFLTQRFSKCPPAWMFGTGGHQCCFFVRDTASKFTLKTQFHLMRRSRSGRRAGLRLAHQNFHPQNLGHIAFEVLINYIQACATTYYKTCALRPTRECDRSREQMRLAPRASHHLAALLPAGTDRSVRAGIQYPSALNAFKGFIRRI